MSGADLLEARAAFARADWQAAKDLYEQVLAADPDEPDALDGLGQSSWWLGDKQTGMELRAKAFAGYQRRGDRERAGFIAVYLAAEYRIAGNASVAQGWLGRAQRLLDGLDDCAALGWLEIEFSKRAAEPVEEERHGRRALELARRMGDSDLEACALSHVGLARVSQGRVEEGMADLDEAMAVAVAGEAEDPLAIGEACCITLVACEQLADVRRARDFGRTVSDFTRRRKYLPLASWCRAIYAHFLMASGRWADAEREFEAALDEFRRLAETDSLAALTGLAELRVRQGRLEEAAQLLAGSEDRRRGRRADGAPPLGARRGRARCPASGATARGRGRRRCLQRPAVRPTRCGRARTRTGRRRARGGRSTRAARDRSSAATTSWRLPSCSAPRPPALPVRTRTCRPSSGRPRASPASSCPSRRARRRVELARALAEHRPELAIESARAGLAIFERLGATRHADEAAGLLRELGAPGRPAPRTAGELTRRESEVLDLLAAGLSNPEIAERLVISPKTAEHHVGHVLAKLGVRNRAEAAAYAARRRAEGGTL